MSIYNIDTLRNADGTYRNAPASLVKGAVNCGHTAHLQTARGTVAFRPYTISEVRMNPRTGRPYFPGERKGWNILVEFYPTGADRSEEIELRTNSKRDAIRFALTHLNGMPHGFQAGDFTSYHANQAERDAVVLAVMGGLVLIEYEMPGTTNNRVTSALVVCDAVGTDLQHVRNYSHRTLPRKWIDAMHRQGTRGWIGEGQREIGPVPFPK